jgi:hypothetical protein
MTIRGVRETVKRGARENRAGHRTENRTRRGADCLGPSPELRVKRRSLHNQGFAGGSATEVREEPEEEREDEAEDEAGDDGEVKRSMLAAMDDVSGKFAEAKRQFGVEIENGADNYQQAPDEE